MTDYQKFKALYDEIDELLVKNVTSATPAFIKWQTKVTRFLRSYYGETSKEVRDFEDTQFSLTIYTLTETQSDYIRACKNGLVECKAVFEAYLEELAEENIVASEQKVIETSVEKKTKVFIVHGHDNALKQEVARLIEKQGFEAIILSEQVNGGKTIIEKIEGNSDVGAAICLFTGDDCGKENDAEKENLRARQNVVFETGYFMGKLGRGNVIVIADKNLELPSDMQGVVYTDSTNWKAEVLQGLDEIGYPIDFNKLFKR